MPFASAAARGSTKEWHIHQERGLHFRLTRLTAAEPGREREGGENDGHIQAWQAYTEAKYNKHGSQR